MKHALWLSLMLFTSSLWGQNSFTISGYITDSSTGENMIQATIYEKASLKGTASNLYGFYTLTLPEGTYEVVFSYIGYTPVKKEITLTSDLKLDIELTPGQLLDAAEVISEQAESIQENVQMGSHKLDMAEVKTLPVIMGESDIFKIIQLMPGIQSGTEGASGFYVRGGGPDQNLILLDGVPIYNATHLFGFFSVFNSDAIRNAEVIKGGFPARYGGRLSSVLDIRMKEGNKKEHKVYGGVGVISGRITAEGPLSEKTSYLVSGRRTWIDVLSRPLIRLGSEGESTGGYYFWDANVKFDHKVDDKNRLYLSFYGGKDRAFARFDNGDVINADQLDVIDLTWGNVITALRWNRELNQKTFLNTTATYSRYKFSTGFEERYRFENNGETFEGTSEFEYFSSINDLALKTDLDYAPNPNHFVKTGAGLINHSFKPGVNTFRSEFDGETEIDTTEGSQTVNSLEFYAYLEDDFKVTERLKFNLGVHFSGTNVENTTYLSVQPRISGRYLLNEKNSIKASATRMTQYLHLLTNSSIGLPTDLWLPVTDVIKPQESLQGAIGWAYEPSKNWEITVESYYKTMNNVIEYKPGATFYTNNDDWQSKVEVGDGWSYGGEFLLRKRTGKFTGWVGYTLSWTERQFDNLNFGNKFPYRYDRRHDIGLALTYTRDETFDMGLVWVYGTGNALSLPVAEYWSMAPGFNNPTGIYSDYIEDRNGYRMPHYHRMDISFNWHKQLDWGTRTWNISFYNLYNRQNPLFLFFDTEVINEMAETNLKGFALFPILPSFSYQFEF